MSMGQVLHTRATTTHAVRKAIQQSNESMVKLAKHYNINVKTVKKWKIRASIEDERMGTKQLGSTVLSPLEERIIVEFRLHTLSSLDDLHTALQDEIPHLSRSSLHRCLKRHGISVLPTEDKASSSAKRRKEYAIGILHIAAVEVIANAGKAYIFIAVDRSSKLIIAKVYNDKSEKTAGDFLRYILQKTPYTIDKIITNTVTEFADLCKKHHIEYSGLQAMHPWGDSPENSRAVINCANIGQLQSYIERFLKAYTTLKPFKALGFQTVEQFIKDEK
ncbi:MAG: IS481 family transposase [Rickettsiales bacterium]